MVTTEYEVIFYPTPTWAVEALLSREEFKGTCWEPACGAGDISKALLKRGFVVYSTDILDYGFGTPGIDFLNDNSVFAGSHKMMGNIITNPPFNASLEFVMMAKRYAEHKIALFLKTTFLEGVERAEMWRDKSFPFKKMYQFSRRVTFKQEGLHKGTGMMAFAWFVWDKAHNGPPTIDWI